MLPDVSLDKKKEQVLRIRKINAMYCTFQQLTLGYFQGELTIGRREKVIYFTTIAVVELNMSTGKFGIDIAQWAVSL